MTGTTGSSPTTTAPATEPTAPEQPEAAATDLDAIAPPPGETFEIGADTPEGPVLVRVNRLRTRELLTLLRGLGRGLGPLMAEIDLEKLQAGEDEAQGEIVGMLLMAIPEAGPELLEFLGTIVRPVAKDDAGRVAKEMANPEIEDTMQVIERVVIQEVADLSKLLGKAQAMWSRVAKAYATRTPAG